MNGEADKNGEVCQLTNKRIPFLCCELDRCSFLLNPSYLNLRNDLA